MEKSLRSCELAFVTCSFVNPSSRRWRATLAKTPMILASMYVVRAIISLGARRLLQAEAARENGEAAGDVTAAEVLGNIDAMN